jgi:hypothetical protein
LREGGLGREVSAQNNGLLLQRAALGCDHRELAQAMP